MDEFAVLQGHNSHTLLLQDREAHLQTLTIELTQIFNHLKKCMVDKDILKVNHEILGPSEADETQQYTCLFDYISDQDIIDLQRQADDEIGEIEVGSADSCLVWEQRIDGFVGEPRR